MTLPAHQPVETNNETNRANTSDNRSPPTKPAAEPATPPASKIGSFLKYAYAVLVWDSGAKTARPAAVAAAIAAGRRAVFWFMVVGLVGFGLLIALIANFLMQAPPSAPTQPAATPAAETTAAPTEPASTSEASAGGTSLDSLEQNAANISPELAEAFRGTYKNTTVNISGVRSGTELDRFNEAVKSFEERTGIDIHYESTAFSDFRTKLVTRVAGGAPPDMADISGDLNLLEDLAKTSTVIDPRTLIKPEWLEQNYRPSYLDLATFDGPSEKVMVGIWTRVIPRSLVWFTPTQFDASGLEDPQTWADLLAATDTIAAGGTTPWCIGIEAGDGTGWPAGDWMAEIMIRTTSQQNYERWAKGELPFTDTVVKNAAAELARIWFNDRYVYGGRASILTTNSAEAPKLLFQQPQPKCWMHKQASFVTGSFPEGVKSGRDYSVFYLPAIDPQYGKPVVVTANMMVAFQDRPEVRAAMAYFSSAASVESWIKAGNFYSPHQDANTDWYLDDTDRKIATLLQSATSMHWSAMDLMPFEVQVAFWKGMTDYVAGTDTLDKVLKDIADSWPL